MLGTDATLESIEGDLGSARAALALDDPRGGAFFLRRAEATASTVGADGGGAFRVALELRTELDCYLIAAEQLHDAGVDGGVVVSVLRRGVETAECILDRLAVAAAS